MLLAADIGNAQIKIGIFQEDDLIYSFRLTSKTRRTSDEFGITMQMFLKNSGIEAAEIQAAIIASVVPDVMHAFVNALKKYFQIETMIVGPGIKTGLKIGAENPKEVGAEMIAAAVAANHYYASPSIVIDFSTTTTYQYIDADQKFEAAVICPGIRTMADALVQSTARLPEIEIRKPKSILGRETISCIQAGIVYGSIGQTEYIVRKMKEESGTQNACVIATGGIGRLIAEETACIDYYDRDLTMKGLNLIYRMNAGKTKQYENR